MTPLQFASVLDCYFWDAVLGRSGILPCHPSPGRNWATRGAADPGFLEELGHNGRNGTYFPWIVSDYPLAQAVEDKIVKAPLVVHQTERANPRTYSNAAVAYQEWIQIALSRWREHRQAYKLVGIKPVLFVMAQDTRDADAIGESIRREPDIKDGEVLVIHVKERGKGKGEIAKVRG
jgi:hypothetical protein